MTSIASNGGVSGRPAWHDVIFKNTARSTSYPGESGPFCDSAGFPGKCSSARAWQACTHTIGGTPNARTH